MNEQTNELAAPTTKNALAQMGERLNTDPARLMQILKSTAFSACKNDDQFASLILVSNEYKLNPLLKEIYAFPAKGGGIVPMVSIDGWLRLINTHPEFDGMETTYAEDGSWCEVSIYHKGRTRPTTHREYLEEVKRNTEPWKQHTYRMHMWKTIMQAGRVAFGFGGIYDEDDAKVVANDGMRNATPTAPPKEKLTIAPIEPVVEVEEPQAEPKKLEVKEPVKEEAPETGTFKIILEQAKEHETPKGKVYQIVGMHGEHELNFATKDPKAYELACFNEGLGVEAIATVYTQKTASGAYNLIKLEVDGATE